MVAEAKGVTDSSLKWAKERIDDSAYLGTRVVLKCDQEESIKALKRATILGMDITEVYPPERVAQVAKRYGLVAGSSMDLMTGSDFTKETDTQLACRRVKDEAPFVLVGSPLAHTSVCSRN